MTPPYEYYGKVKLVRKTTFRDSKINGKYSGEFKRPRYVYFIKFNQAGKRIELTEEFDDNGNSLQKTIYKYDANGNNLCEEVYADGKIFKPYVYRYDAKNRMILRLDSLGNGQVSKIKYVYNTTGTQMTEYYYEGRNTLCNDSTVHYYDQGEQDTLSLHYTLYGGSAWHTKFDSKGNRVEIVIKAIETNTIASATYYKYDEAGNEIEKSVNSDKTKGKIMLERKTNYDLYGNQTGREDYNYEGKLNKTMKYEYTYDKVGNWITRTVFCNGDKTGYEERTFEYF